MNRVTDGNGVTLRALVGDLGYAVFSDGISAPIGSVVRNYGAWQPIDATGKAIGSNYSYGTRRGAVEAVVKNHSSQGEFALALTLRSSGAGKG